MLLDAHGFNTARPQVCKESAIAAAKSSSSSSSGAWLLSPEGSGQKSKALELGLRAYRGLALQIQMAQSK